MKCEKFWDEVTDFLPDCSINRETISPDLKTHLETCPRCRREFELVCKGLGALNREIHSEESASFWHGMREEVRNQVKIPRRRFPALSGFFSPWSLGWAAAVLVLFLLVFRGIFLNGPSLTRQDLVCMFENDPIVSLYNQAQPDTRDPDRDEPDPYIYSGLSDAWTSVMAETLDEQAEAGQSHKKRRNSHENNVSDRINELSHPIV